MSDNLKNSWIDRTVAYQKCKKCPSGHLDTRIPRGFIVKYLFFWLDVRRYKCNNCQSKVYIRTIA